MTPGGTYIKSVCFLGNPGYSQAGAYKSCEGYGMKLFVIDSTDAQKELFKYSSILFGNGNWVIIWVDGVKEADGKWYYYSYGKTPAWSGLAWRVNAKKAKGCLAATDYYVYDYLMDGFACDGTCQYACELFK